jgi:adenylosuccinate lyase
MAKHDRYRSPLAERNASARMQAIWSPQRRHETWRRLWLALAEAQKQLGIEIQEQQLEQMRAHLDDIDFDAAGRHEKRLRHDVMAHIHAFGDVAPLARPIIHLGATSQFVVCNTDLLLIREALRVVAAKIAAAVDALGRFAVDYRDLPTLGFTHLQPAQPTTVGRRAAQWGHDLALCLEEVENRMALLRFRGVKGTTGTQASFLALFDGDHEKVEQLDVLVARKMGWDPDKRLLITAQTYPRVVDGLVLSSVAAVAAVAAKFATDLRLLANRKELEEPFGAEQVGSSAMPYKRNPMRCERICGLARFVIGLVQVPFTTAAEQWLERTLDDSSTRRLTLPEPFLAVDGVLDLVVNVARGIVVYEKTVRANLEKELPFMATENLLMAAVQRGADRQQVHETLRRHSQEAARQVKEEGADNDLLERLGGEPVFQGIDFNAVLEPAGFIGRAPQQVDAFLSEIVEPIRKRYAGDLEQKVDLRV